MKRYLLTLLLIVSTTIICAQGQETLKGYEYGNATAPDGTEWQSPTRLGYNKLQPRAYFCSFATEEEARKVLSENSSRRISLDGTWKFCFSKTPADRPADFYQSDFDCDSWDEITVPSNWNLAGLQKDGTQKYGTPIYVNQPVIFYHEVKKDDWKEGVMRTPPTNWTTYEYRNEVGSYRRNFTIPKTWKGQELFIEFDGVDSFFYLWINSKYVGFSKNSRDIARFDITPYAHVGENTIAVEVYRNSDGSFLEAQDMFRLPGIYRSVSVYATPKVHIGDLRVEAGWKEGESTLKVHTAVESLNGKQGSDSHVVEYSLYENELHSDDNKLIATFDAQIPQQLLNNLKPWTGEAPHLYVLVATLKDRKGRVREAVSTQIGFRTVEIKDVPAGDDEFGLSGRYFLVNGKPVKLKGVNRHETNPESGHAITREQMEEEVMMMKRANINHVRTSHYTCDPYFYYLCNKYGIYLEAEANLESHEYYYGDASLSHPAEWRAAHVARMMELAHTYVNAPSIVIWSLGNEAGPGDNFKASYEALKAFDGSRPVQYERNNDIVDMGSNQYPSVDWVRQAVKGNMGIKYPFHISEYAHSMGNAVGNLQDYWDAIESTNFFCGGAIWDWVDQSLYNYTPDGHRYLAYGGDFGDTPNDGQFVMNGILFGNLEPKPQYYEVKKVYQNVGIQWNGNGLDIFNKYYYSDDLSGYDFCYQLMADGKVAKEGTMNVGSIQPRTHKMVEIPGVNIENLSDYHEYFLNVELRLKTDRPWAKAGYVQACEQLPLKNTDGRNWGIASSVEERQADIEPLTTSLLSDDQYSRIDGKDFSIIFSNTDGSIHQLNYHGKDVFKEGCGPHLDAFRAWVNNDNWAYQNWYANGIHQLRHKVTNRQITNNSDQSVSILFTIESQAPYGARLEGGDRNWKKLTELTDKPFGPDDFRFTQNLVYTVYPDGNIEMQAAIQSNNPQLVLPRLGYALILPKEMNQLAYYGRGPVDNYPDRKTSQPIGIYSNEVAKEFEPFPKPQDMANHQDTRWCSLTRADGNGVRFIADGTMSFSVLPWSAQALAMANHPHELPASDGNHLHLDLAVTGLGGNSCGQGGPLDNDRVKATPHTFGFMICPIYGKEDHEIRRPEFKGLAPLLITRDKAGYVSVNSPKNGSTVFYTINAEEPYRQYEKPFLLREGGTVTAYESSASSQSATPVRFSQHFPKLENISASVLFASSVESGEGDAEHLTDGDPSTYWHTMYSVTVANFPHWVDFDCGTVQNLKGFIYLPRQDSRNGNIKDYRIQVSQDGKNWSAPICEGQFSFDIKEKRVLFPHSVKARFLRFTALSSNDDQDFATGAEFTILQDD